MPARVHPTARRAPQLAGDGPDRPVAGAAVAGADLFEADVQVIPRAGAQPFFPPG
jgi:hypothetical protein